MSQKRHGVEEALLGFDARERFLEPGSLWPPERRAAFLLREDVRKPLSVDTSVWPSLFGEGLSDVERVGRGLEALRAPGWRGPNQELWDSLSRMQSALGLLPSEAYWTVAVSWVSVEGFSESRAGNGPYREKMEPEAVSTDWTLLGFDVADAGFISGLSNCGYTPEEVAGLRATWASALNAHHLFDDLEKALAFRELTEARVPEHAPFFVYALRRLVQVRGK
jgi:hypothetical protein